MIGNSRKRVGFARSKSNVSIMLARILAVLTLASLPWAFSATNAKYTAMATSTRSGRVAIWNVDLDFDYVPVTPISIPGIPINGSVPGHPLVLFFQGRTADPLGIGAEVKEDSSFPAKFTNNSEVTARFVPTVEVDAPTDAAALAIVKSQIRFMYGTTDITTTGLEIPPGGVRDVDVVIKNCTFTNLKVGATCEQVD